MCKILQLSLSTIDKEELRMTTNIHMEQLKKDAVEIFCSGFACSESVIYALRKHFQIDLSDDAIAMSSGFPWGLGGGGCLCGDRKRHV